MSLHHSLILAALLVAVHGCRSDHPDSASAAQEGPAEVVDPAQLTINGIKLGMARHEVLNRLGTPLSVSKPDTAEVLSEPLQTLTYTDLAVVLLGDEVYEVSCLGPACSTLSGLSVDAPRRRVEELLGQGVTVADGIITYRSTRSDCGVTFTYYADRVGTFRLWCDFS